jgi:hypothetical protein
LEVAPALSSLPAAQFTVGRLCFKFIAHPSCAKIKTEYNIHISRPGAWLHPPAPGRVSERQCMDTVTISSLAGAFLSLAFEYVPGLSDWYAALTANEKRLVMLGACLAVALGLWVYSCQLSTACYAAGGPKFIETLVALLVVNQATHALSPR